MKRNSNIRRVQKFGPNSCCVVIPADIVKRMRIKKGTSLVFVERKGVLRIVKLRRKLSVQRIFA